MSETVYGIHAVMALLTNKEVNIEQLYLQVDRQDKRMIKLQTLAYERQVKFTKLSKEELNKRFNEQHQGVVAIIAKARDYTDSDLEHLFTKAGKLPLILILDGITDPHNLGACLRSAEAAGVDFVIVPKDNSASLTPVVRKVASGAAERVPLVKVTNLSRVIKYIQQQGVWVFGATGEASQNIYQCDFSGAVAIVMGAEGKGMRRLTRETCDHLFALPMQGQIESLNVSVATGISLYEVMRQRNL